MDNAPPFVQLARSDGQLWPPITHDQPTLRGGAIEPGPYGILINLDNPRGRPDRMACRSGATGQFPQRRVMRHIESGCSVRPGDATPTRATQGLALAPRGPILDQPALAKAHAVNRTGRSWTISGVPVQMILG